MTTIREQMLALDESGRWFTNFGQDAQAPLSCGRIYTGAIQFMRALTEEAVRSRLRDGGLQVLVVKPHGDNAWLFNASPWASNVTAAGLVSHGGAAFVFISTTSQELPWFYRWALDLGDCETSGTSTLVTAPVGSVWYYLDYYTDDQESAAPKSFLVCQALRQRGFECIDPFLGISGFFEELWWSDSWKFGSYHIRVPVRAPSSFTYDDLYTALDCVSDVPYFVEVLNVSRQADQAYLDVWAATKSPEAALAATGEAAGEVVEAVEESAKMVGEAARTLSSILSSARPFIPVLLWSSAIGLAGWVGWEGYKYFIRKKGAA